MSVSNVVEAFRPVSELPWYEQLELPSLSDDQHLARAIESGRPHSYIAERAGLLAHDEGFRGLGMINAVTMHLRVMNNDTVEPSRGDIAVAQKSISFTAAVHKIGENLPPSYRATICAEKLALIRESRERDLNLR